MTLVMDMNVAGRLSYIAMLQTCSATTLKMVPRWGLSCRLDLTGICFTELGDNI